ncbi:MAG: hypothetical protein Q7S92_05200 [Candidatus Diapherotrites archaeon]|nr:hypothetical protein [Candidatus Diapherotrites archaeon]
MKRFVRSKSINVRERFVQKALRLTAANFTEIANRAKLSKLDVRDIDFAHQIRKKLALKANQLPLDRKKELEKIARAISVSRLLTERNKTKWPSINFRELGRFLPEERLWIVNHANVQFGKKFTRQLIRKARKLVTTLDDAIQLVNEIETGLKYRKEKEKVKQDAVVKEIRRKKREHAEERKNEKKALMDEKRASKRQKVEQAERQRLNEIELKRKQAEQQRTNRIRTRFLLRQINWARSIEQLTELVSTFEPEMRTLGSDQFTQAIKRQHQQIERIAAEKGKQELQRRAEQAERKQKKADVQREEKREKFVSEKERKLLREEKERRIADDWLAKKKLKRMPVEVAPKPFVPKALLPKWAQSLQEKEPEWVQAKGFRVNFRIMNQTFRLQQARLLQEITELRNEVLRLHPDRHIGTDTIKLTDIYQYTKKLRKKRIELTELINQECKKRMRQGIPLIPELESKK